MPRIEKLYAKARSMNMDAADAIVSVAKAHRTRADDDYILGVWLHLFPIGGFFALPPEGLGEFWRLFAEAVFNRDLVACPSHPLAFHDGHGGYDLEVTDEWGDAWWLVMGSPQRSECGTPLRRRSSLGIGAYLDVTE